MRITFILPSYPWKPGGGFRAVYEYASHLVERGHDVYVVHTRRLLNAQAPQVTNLHQQFRLRAAVLRDCFLRPRPSVRWQTVDQRVHLLYAPDLASEHVPDADAVFATWWATAEGVLELPRSKGEKFYLIQHYETWGGPRERVDATWHAPLHKAVISGWLYNVGTQIGCRDIAKIGYGTDHSRFRVLAPIRERRKRVAMMFSPAEWKGSADGIEALQRAKQGHPDLEAVLFGMCPRPRFLPRWIVYKRDPSQRTLVAAIYNSARIFLCPSWTEGFALPPAEAMACGCAVVSTDCGGNRDYAEHGVTALLSAPKDPEALARNVLRLLNEEDLRLRIAAEGHRRIQSFTWERSTDLLEQYIKQCLASGLRANQCGSTAGLTHCREVSANVNAYAR